MRLKKVSDHPSIQGRDSKLINPVSMQIKDLLIWQILKELVPAIRNRQPCKVGYYGIFIPLWGTLHVLRVIEVLK